MQLDLKNLSAQMEHVRIKPKNVHQRNSPSQQQRRQSRKQKTPTRQRQNTLTASP